MGRPPSDLDDYLEWQLRLENQKACGLTSTTSASKKVFQSPRSTAGPIDFATAFRRRSQAKKSIEKRLNQALRPRADHAQSVTS